MPNLIRVTMFKVPSQENIQKILGFYRILSSAAVKPENNTSFRTEKPYILSLHAGPAHEDARSQGFTLIAKSEFRNLEDMKYYDDGCEAHATLKKHLREEIGIAGAPGSKEGKPGVEGMMMVCWTPEVINVL